MIICLGYLTNLHPSEHKESYPEEKYYGRPSSHVPVHPGSISIPQPNPVTFLKIQKQYKTYIKTL